MRRKIDIRACRLPVYSMCRSLYLFKSAQVLSLYKKEREHYCPASPPPAFLPYIHIYPFHPAFLPPYPLFPEHNLSNYYTYLLRTLKYLAFASAALLSSLGKYRSAGTKLTMRQKKASFSASRRLSTASSCTAMIPQVTLNGTEEGSGVCVLCVCGKRWVW